MGRRRQSRELIVQFLYLVDLRGESDMEKLLEEFWSEMKPDAEVKEYSERIIKKVIEKKQDIDKLISVCVKNWDMTRIAIVDKNILRASVCELLYMDDIPPIVSINEAVDIAKKYGTADSGKFVNGILDKIRLEHTKKH